jgi:hypothetical protein
VTRLEKMAYEYLEQCCHNVDDGQMDAFVTGFKTAREMALEQYGDVVTAKSVLEILSTLGDEEV